MNHESSELCAEGIALSNSTLSVGTQGQFMAKVPAFPTSLQDCYELMRTWPSSPVPPNMFV